MRTDAGLIARPVAVGSFAAALLVGAIWRGVSLLSISSAKCCTDTSAVASDFDQGSNANHYTHPACHGDAASDSHADSDATPGNTECHSRSSCFGQHSNAARNEMRCRGE